MPSIILLNKPFQVLCQFRDNAGRETLKNLLPAHSGYYPAGRLDFDSEGLLLLTNEGKLQNRVSDPKHKLVKIYWVQVEGIPDTAALQSLCSGVELKDGLTRPAGARLMDPPPGLWPRNPPIRERQSIPTQWLELAISEGRNRQVRRMTAAVGHPTLRLIRAAIGPWELGDLQPGQYRTEQVNIAQPASNRSPPGTRQRKSRRRRR